MSTSIQTTATPVRISDATLHRPDRDVASRITALRFPALGLILALSAILNTRHLAQNGYANTFYSSGVKSMLRSFHNFIFVSFDPGGLITIDKPPLGMWVQVASVKLFGFSPMSLLLPEAILGVLSVAALYWTMTRCFGPFAALIAALALAVFPSFVAVSRDNNVDALLIFLMILAAGTALRAIESGRWRWLIGCAVLVGLAFNTKTLAAYLIVPGIGLGYLVCAPGSLPKRLLQLLAAGVVLAIISLSWLTYVDLTPASQRPYVGGSTNNSELGLTFGYNGLGRAFGQSGGPGRIPVRAGAMVILPRSVTKTPTSQLGTSKTGQQASAQHRQILLPPSKKPVPERLPNGHDRKPTPFGGPIGPLRLFGSGLGGQGGWMLPFAFFGFITLGLSLLLSSTWLTRRRSSSQADTASSNGDGDSQPHGVSRHDKRLAGLFVLGGWFVIEGLFLSLSKGIVHPYYVSALGPGSAAMIGAGAITFVELRRNRSWLLILAPIAVGATVAAQLVLLHRESYLHSFIPILIAAVLAGLLALLAVRRLAGVAVAVIIAALLVAPAAFAKTTWEDPVEGTFPTAGPHAAVGLGNVGVAAVNRRIDRQLLHFIETKHPGTRWSVLTVSSVTAAPFVLLGSKAGALGGYSGTDPALDGKTFAHLVRRHEARYVLLGGAYASRGGNGATVATLAACRRIPGSRWRHIRYLSYFSLALFDCAGRERQMEAAS